MIECDRFTFSGPPKTGTRWMAEVMRSLGSCPQGGRFAHLPFRVDGKPALSFVRDPCDWLISLWRERFRPFGVPAVDAFLAYPRSSAEEFIEAYLAGPVGQIGELFASYPADRRWRLEDNPQALVDWLGHAIVDARRFTSEPMDVAAELRERVYRHESALAGAWGYPIPRTRNSS